MKKILTYSEPLRAEIKKTIRNERGKAGQSISWRADFLERLAPYATTGKLLRGNLICFSFRIFSGREPDQSVIDVAVALELMHSALLIHDDVMDNDEYRRGKPSMHTQYVRVGTDHKLVELERFGSNMAICGADLCLFIAFGLLADKPSVIGQLFSTALIEVCDGQMQDIYYQSAMARPSKKAIYDLMRTKTASYTLSLPLMVGASLAGQPSKTLNDLRRIGNAAGLIYQIRDDELGTLGDTSKTGKPVGADIREGKKTLLYYYLMKRCGGQTRSELEEIFGNQNIGNAEIVQVQKLIRQHGIPALLSSDIRVQERMALDSLTKLDISKSDEAELRSMIAFCAKRRA